MNSEGCEVRPHNGAGLMGKLMHDSMLARPWQGGEGGRDMLHPAWTVMY